MATPVPSRWSNLRQRIQTASLLAVISLIAIWWGRTPFFLEISLFALAGSCEIFDLVERKGLRPLRRSGTLCTLLLLASAWGAGLTGLAHATLLSLLAILSLCVLRHRYRSSMLLEAACTFLGVLYVGWLFSFLLLLRALPQGAAWVTLLIAMISLTDSGAYFVGRALGRNKLCPQLSPQKTVEGALGGLLLPAWLGWLLAPMLQLEPSLGLALGAGTSMFGQIGDIWESALKREVSLKDAGELLGSHGGVLDRFDSLAFAAPFFYLFLNYGIR